MANADLAIIAAVAFAGGVLYALYGFLDSGLPFDGKVFGKSVIAALFAGVAFGVAYNFADQMSMRDILTAFGSGVGVTAVGSKLLKS
jgi:hypothetical protein